MKRSARMIVSTEGLEGSGKTDFALRNTPRPLVYLDFDFGAEGVGGDEGGRLWEGVTRHAFDLTAPIGASDAATQAHALKVIKDFLAKFRASVGVAHTVVVDTFTAAWAGQRLARVDDRYVLVEEEFRALVRSAYTTEDTNLILVHHMRPDWKRDSSGKSYKAGTYSRDSLDGILTMVQLGIRQRFVQPDTRLGTPGRFEMDILKCRDNPTLTGMTLPSVDFPTLCSMVCPGVGWV